MRRLIRILIIPISIIFLLDYFLWGGGPDTVHPIALSTAFVLLILYEGIFTLQLLFDKALIVQSIFVHSLPNFWFNAGLFIFHNAALMYLLPYDFLAEKLFPKEEPSFLRFYIVMGLVMFFMGIMEMIFFYIGLRKLKKLNN